MSPAQPRNAKKEFNPDDFRMTVGEHLEDLRWRIILGLGGFILALAVCLIFGDHVFVWFCKPLYKVLAAKGLNTQLHYDELGEGFTTWIQVCLVTATAVASPWLVYQIWQFIAAGLYPHERKYVTKYAPLSIALLVGGMIFVYTLVLPWTIIFFLDFADSVPVPRGGDVTTTQAYTPFALPKLPGNPPHPRDGEMWIDTVGQRIRLFNEGQMFSVRYGSDNLLAPDIKVSEYIDLVVGMLITFGLAFQLPLVVLALQRIGIVERQTLKHARRYIYFGIAVLSAAITPGDTITATVLLTFPLILLYELGIWLSREPRPATSA
jgi:sec-independent protein translocase protein TatC